ncbi:hypothetical protein HELRODRAFT_167028 [Helobdella robusta]|uniref:Endonuclease/exonuclease/phosphatase domain-containing protein n=1 Tax=Helobdella robusta TaxID=6412 RepID=T1EYX2_HELRO|nr:hypothetical protein HELRODRAFT_167028 [Helobdella robusta]ESO11934.1 hypothetical protein HELRODRAFT_167028 [Helobdella robusta]
MTASMMIVMMKDVLITNQQQLKSPAEVNTDRDTKNTTNKIENKTKFNQSSINKNSIYPYEDFPNRNDNNNIIILQWNIRGMRNNLPELQILIAKYKPHIICLQETKTTDDKQIILKNYSSYYKAATPTKTNPSAGTAIYIHHKITQSSHQLKTDHHFIASRVTCNKSFTICNGYIKPNNIMKSEELKQLIQQIPKPFLLVGDFNAHNQLWGSQNSNTQGKELEKTIIENNICLIKPTAPTMFHEHTNTSSIIDLVMTSPTMFEDIEWEAEEDLHGSDHFPIILTMKIKATNYECYRLNYNKIDWNKFKIFTDSLSTLLALKQYYPRHQLILQIQNKIHDIISNKNHISLIWIPSHIGIEGNERVDQLAAQAHLDPPSNIPIPYYDIRVMINDLICSKWQKEWDKITNFLKIVMPEHKTPKSTNLVETI